MTKERIECPMFSIMSFTRTS